MNELRDLRDKATRDVLAEMSTDEVAGWLGRPRVATIMARPQPPRPKPALATDDPATAQAMGRCAVSRTRGFPASLGKLHGDRCAWCEFPVAELAAGCAYAEWASGYVIAELFVWVGTERSSYERSGQSGRYTNPTWREFWALPVAEREQRIAAVSLVAA